MEHRTIDWMFTLGQYVHWAGHAHTSAPWRIVQRRYTERDIMPPVVQYGLVAPYAPPERGMYWADEPDLVAAAGGSEDTT